MSNEYPTHPRLGVGAVVFKEGEVLLVRRNKAPAAGEWAIPGGGVEIGETLSQAAERETLEETGVTVRAEKPVYTFESIVRDPDGGVRFHYVIVDLEAEYLSGEPTPGDDAGECRWIGPSAYETLEPVNPSTRELLKTIYNFGGSTYVGLRCR